MEQYQSSPKDLYLIQMMHKIRQRMLQNGQQALAKCLLLQQKIIYTSLICFQSFQNDKIGSIAEQISNLSKIIVQFIQKINKLTMENYEKSTQQYASSNQKLINKCISLLMIPQINKYLKNVTELSKLKILSFNNLCCIYKKKKKFGIALRAINHALDIEEQLIKAQNNEQKYDIIPTYLNKAAIYSQMKKHNQAVQIIMKAHLYIQNIENELLKQIQATEDASQKQRLAQKRYYGLYMKMIILYNMGVQKQHLRLIGQALEYYKQSKQIALIINNELMTNKLQSVIQSILYERKQKYA